jgi:hypothetical protein
VVGLSDPQIEAVLARCRRQLLLLRAARGFSAWLRTSRPICLVGLFALCAARILSWPLSAAGAALAVALAGCALWTWLRPPPALPDWLCVAQLDRAAHAQGALLARFETGVARDPVPEAALTRPLPRWLPQRQLAQLALWSAGYAACLLAPLPERARAAEIAVTPLPVQRAEQLLRRVPQRDPQARAFVADAKQSLRELAARSGGLGGADFAALERVEQQSRSLIARRAQQLAGQRAGLAELSSLLAAYAAEGGSEQAAAALREGLERMRDAFDGQGRASLQALLEQLAQAGAKAESSEAGQSSGRGQGAFDPDAVADLRASIGELQQLAESELEALSGAAGEPQRGPGIAPLRLDQQAHAAEAQFEARNFHTEQDRETVLLATGTSQRADAPSPSQRTAARQRFAPGNDSEYWDKRSSPRQERLLERYFEGTAR